MELDISPSGVAPGSANRATGLSIVASRACGTCTMCCKVAAVLEVGKPNGVWCPHCAKDKRCTIYPSRPQSCRSFYCQWMIEPGLGPEWKPDRAKFALVKTEFGRRLTALVDPGFPSAWRRAPYYENLKQWSLETARRLPEVYLVDVLIGSRNIVILPDRDVDLGSLDVDEGIQVSQTERGIAVMKVKHNAAA